MARQSTSITSLPRSPEDDQRARMIKYSVMMAIRVVCIGLCLVVPGWWLLVCVLGAVFLPYVAVLIANATDTRGIKVERPESTPRMIETPNNESASNESPKNQDEDGSEEVRPL